VPQPLLTRGILTFWLWIGLGAIISPLQSYDCHDLSSRITFTARRHSCESFRGLASNHQELLRIRR
jgi:hypothetical protein